MPVSSDVGVGVRVVRELEDARPGRADELPEPGAGPGVAAVVGRTAHQAPPCVQTLDCGFSPVFAETGSAVSGGAGERRERRAGRRRRGDRRCRRRDGHRTASRLACRRTSSTAQRGRAAGSRRQHGRHLPRRRGGASDRAGRRGPVLRSSLLERKNPSGTRTGGGGDGTGLTVGRVSWQYFGRTAAPGPSSFGNRRRRPNVLGNSPYWRWIRTCRSLGPRDLRPSDQWPLCTASLPDGTGSWRPALAGVLEVTSRARPSVGRGADGLAVDASASSSPSTLGEPGRERSSGPAGCAE